MGSKDQYMSGLDVSSGGRHSMDMMPPSRRNPLGKHVIVGQNGVAAVLDLERRTRKRSQMKKRLKTRRLQVRYMH
jgi:hypothetical protein